MTSERVVRLGAVEYLNARPLVYGLMRSPRFDLRFDVPSECARLLHANVIDVGLIPSIEYARGAYCIAPDVAIVSRGPVASVGLFTRKPIADVRSIALDTSSRTSVALVRVLCARAFSIRPSLADYAPDLDAMLAACDAALVIGDNALFLGDPRPPGAHALKGDPPGPGIQKIDLGEVWTAMTGLPFVYAFWAGRSGALVGDEVAELRRARDGGVCHTEELAREYFSGAPDRQPVGAAYLRDNIKYDLGADERAGLELFYQYAAEAGVVNAAPPLRFFGG